MLVLHGIYDHGKVEIEEKELPDIKTQAVITLLSDTSSNKQQNILKRQKDFLEQGFNMGKKLYHSRQDIYDR